MKIFFHIGTHKTGTTAIQRVLTENSDALLLSGLYYKPDIGENNHHSIVAKLLNQETLDSGYNDIFSSIKMAQEAGAKICLFSSEMFVANRLDIRLFRERLLGFDYKILAYIRAPDEVVTSAFNEIVRDDQLRWSRSISEPPLSYDPSYWKILGEWICSFTPDQLSLAPFSRDQWKERDLIADFLSNLSVSIPTGFKRDFQDRDLNISLSPSLIEVCRLINNTHSLAQQSRISILRGIFALQEESPRLYPKDTPLMTRKQRKKCFDLLAGELAYLRPYFRGGFDESFLHWKRLGFNEIFTRILGLTKY